MRAKLICLLCLPVVSSICVAQPAPELVTDRPDQTESSTTVSPGSAQLEGGWLRERGDGGSASESTGFLLRIGLVDALELRLGWDGWIDENSGPSSIDGAGDAQVGLKWHLFDESGRRPDTALLIGTSVPVGANEVTSDRFDPAVRLAFSHELSDRLGLAYNVGAEWSTSGEGGPLDTTGAAIWTAALGIGVSDRIGAFVELFGSEALSGVGGSEISLDGGVTVLLRGNLQLDLYAGVGLSSDAPDSFLGVGVSWRWPQ